MPTINIDNKEYDLDGLSTEAKAQLTSLQFCDVELQRLTAQAAVLQTARWLCQSPSRGAAFAFCGRHDEVQLSVQTGGLIASTRALLPTLALASS